MCVLRVEDTLVDAMRCNNCRSSCQFMQAYQGICEAIYKTLRDQAIAILQPGAETTPVQTGPT